MKVTELFEGGLKKGSYLPAKYDAKSKMLTGGVKDWMDLGGVSKEDIKKAVDQIKKSDEFKNMSEVGARYEPTPAKEANGTLNFHVPKISDTPHGGFQMSTGTYQIHANGQIRYTSAGPYGAHVGKIRSPKPRMRSGDPVASLISTYKQALLSLHATASKSSAHKASQDPEGFLKKLFKTDELNKDTIMKGLLRRMKETGHSQLGHIIDLLKKAGYDYPEEFKAIEKSTLASRMERQK